MHNKFIGHSLLTLAFLIPCLASANPSASDIVAESLKTFYYAGNDIKVNINMKLINSKGGVRERDLLMLRKNIDNAGEQKYFIYFNAPSDVKGTSFMVWKYKQQEDDRWIFIPAVKLVKRIAADDKRSSFIGSDFTYEDVSGRNIKDEQHSILKEEMYADQLCYLIESIPASNVDYAKRLSWIDKQRHVPLKEQYIDDRGMIVREFTADKVENVNNYWSVTARTMKNLQTGHRTEVTWLNIEYNVGLDENVFSERYLRNPPRQWIR